MTGSTQIETRDLQAQKGLPLTLLPGQAGRALQAVGCAPVSTVAAVVLIFLREGSWRSGTDHTINFSCQMQSLGSTP